MPMRGRRGGFGGYRRGPRPPMFGPRPRRMMPPPPPMFGPRPYRRRGGCGCLPLFLMALPVAALVGLLVLVL